MTEQMAIEYLLNRYLVVGSPVNPPKEECEKQNAVIDMAIQALEKQSMVNEILNELQQYRAIGTVEEIQTAMKYMRIAKMHGTVGKVIDACVEYESIGTVEELQALKEKSVAKKAEIYTTTVSCMGRDAEIDVYCCPSCGIHLGLVDETEQFEQQYCQNCGQLLA